MKYVCDPCFQVFQLPAPVVTDIPGTVLPTLALPCDRCGTVVYVSGSGHLVNNYPQFPRPVLSGSL